LAHRTLPPARRRAAAEPRRARQVRSASLLPMLRSFLKLYTVIPLAKLAALTEIDVASLRQQLLAMKRKSTLKECGEGAPSALDGEWTSTGDVSCYIDGDVVHVVDSKPSRRRDLAAVTAPGCMQRLGPSASKNDQAQCRYVNDFVNGIRAMNELERTILNASIDSVPHAIRA